MEQPVKERLKQKMDERRVKIPVLAELLGIPKGRIYGWYRDNSNPKADDLQKLEKWIAGETFTKSKEKVARGTEQIDIADSTPLHDLILSNSKLADAALINAEANKLREEKELRLVQSNAELTAMLKQSGVNPEGTVIIDTSMLMKIRDAIAEIGLSSKKWLTQPEALREAGILLGLHVGDKEKRKGIQTGADKTRTA